MTQVLAVLVAAAALTSAPDDVTLGLHGMGIDVVDAQIAAPAVGPRAARHVALKRFGGFAYPYTSGWVRVGRVSVHLVRVVSSNSRGPLGLFPDQIAWMVVIRDVTIPNLGAHRPPWVSIATMAVFVRTDMARYILAASF